VRDREAGHRNRPAARSHDDSRGTVHKRRSCEPGQPGEGADLLGDGLDALLLLAGAAIAPTYASVYVMADRAAPKSAMTEAFAWLATAAAVGGAAGAALAGSLVEHAGYASAFGLAGLVGAIAVVCITVRSGLAIRAPDLALEPAAGIELAR
jgi:hypothetical protein